MVETLKEIVELPMRGWECRNCEEPYNSRQMPNQEMCSACARETIWKLPDRAAFEIFTNLSCAVEGDQIKVFPDRAAAMVGTVTDVQKGMVVLDGERDSRYIYFRQPSNENNDSEEWQITLCSEADEDPRWGDDIHHVIVTPEEDVKVDTRITKRVKTPAEEIVHGAATHAGLNPNTVEVESVRMVDEDLEFELRGDA